jgi:acetylserotonin N-methyltransferase
MNDLTAAPATDPSPIYRSRDELFADDMFIAALKGFDFFSWLETTPSTVEGIASHFGFHARPVDVMTTLFVARGLLERRGDVLQLSAMAREHLVSWSPWFLGPYFPKVSDRQIAMDLLEILRTGQPANYQSRKDSPDWHTAMETEAFAEEFIAAMDCRGALAAQALAKRIDLRKRRRLLDVAGGSGIYACAFCAHFPGLSASVLEKPPVDRIALRGIERRGFGSRIDVVPRDMLAEPLPDGYDVHLWSNVLHDWDVPIVRQLLAASAAALPSGGAIVIHDAFLNADKTGPAQIAAYSVLLMHVTQGRCFSTAEMTTWLAEAGFSTPIEVPSAVGRSALVARKA